MLNLFLGVVSTAEKNSISNIIFKGTILLEKIYMLIIAAFVLYILYLIIVILKIYIKKNKTEL